MSGGAAPAAALLWLCLGNVSPICPCKGGGEEGFPPQNKPPRNQTKDLSAHGSLLAHVSPHSRPTERLHSWCWWCSGFSEYPEYEKSMWKAAGSEMRSLPRAALQELLPAVPLLWDSTGMGVMDKNL